MGLLREVSSREKSATFLTGMLAIVFVLLYNLVFPRALGAELFLVPSGFASLAEDRTAALSPGGHFFAFGDREGYWDNSGQIVRSQARRPQSVVDADKLAWYDAAADRVVVESPQGIVGTIPGQKYPFWSRGNLFTMDENRMGISSFDSGGKLLWSKHFASLITAVDSTKSTTVVGTVDGKVQVFDSRGITSGPFLPGGSRLAVIFNVAMSPDSRELLVLAGVEPKRFLVLEKGTSDFRPVFHKPLQEAKPWPTALGYLSDGKILYHEVDGAVALMSADHPEQETLLKFPGALLEIKDVPALKLVALVAGQDGHQTLLLDSLSGYPVLVAQYQSVNTFVQAMGNTLLLGVDQSLLRLELRTR